MFNIGIRIRRRLTKHSETMLSKHYMLSKQNKTYIYRTLYDIIAKVETAIRTLPDREEVENIRAKTSFNSTKGKASKEKLTNRTKESPALTM